MNQINQIQATYNMLEDRIRLTIKTHDDQVFIAWLTRRFMTILLPVLHGQHPVTGEAILKTTEPQVPTEVEEAKPLNSDFEQNYQNPEDPSFPLGKEPILLSKISFKDTDSPEVQFILSPENDHGFQLPLNPELMTALLQIISQALHVSNWQLDSNTIMDMPEKSRLQ